MPTTSNFGWTTPADTDLVKDGAAAIRTLGNGVDASLVDLKGGTTGQILSKASNTDLDYTWIANDQGDITEVAAGTGISVASGTGPVPTVTNTVATAFDAKGDLIGGTGSDTFAKLTVGTNETRLVADSAQTTGLKYVADTTNYAIAAKGDLLVGTAADTLAALTVGTNGHTLVADSAETTGLKWAAPAAGGWTSLGTATLSASITSISFTATGYQQICLQVINPNCAVTGGVIIKPNGSSSIACMVEDGVYQNATRNTAARYKNTIYNGNYNITGNGSLVFYFDLPASTSTVKAFRGTSMVKESNGDLGFFGYQGFVGTDSALTSFSFEHQGGNFTGGSVEVWGIK